MSKHGYNCGKHEKRVQPHWDGKHWCNGRPSTKEVRK